jgi:ABC-type uncharacterized transport system substrate-binding protein
MAFGYSVERRTLVALIGATAVFASLTARAQRAIPVIGVLVPGAPDPAAFLMAFREGLREIGYIEGENIRIDVRSSEGRPERLPELAADLIAERVDVIVAFQTPAVLAAKRATTGIPIVMAQVGAPVETGLVTSLARPGGNITGLSGVAADLAPKNLGYLREMVPSLRRVLVLLNAPDPFSKPFLEQNRTGAAQIGIEIVPVSVDGPEQLRTAFARLNGVHVDGAIFPASFDPKQLAELALGQHMPAVSHTRAFAEAGGLISYSPVQVHLWRRAAAFVDKILKGAKTSDLPVEQPIKFELVINLNTAKALGLTVPQPLLVQADEVIE